jgi:hypothetical protein
MLPDSLEYGTDGREQARLAHSTQRTGGCCNAVSEVPEKYTTAGGEICRAERGERKTLSPSTQRTGGHRPLGKTARRSTGHILRASPSERREREKASTERHRPRLESGPGRIATSLERDSNESRREGERRTIGANNRRSEGHAEIR